MAFFPTGAEFLVTRFVEEEQRDDRKTFFHFISSYHPSICTDGGTEACPRVWTSRGMLGNAVRIMKALTGGRSTWTPAEDGNGLKFFSTVRREKNWFLFMFVLFLCMEKRKKKTQDKLHMRYEGGKRPDVCCVTVVAVLLSCPCFVSQCILVLVVLCVLIQLMGNG